MKKNLFTVAVRNREEHFQSYLLDWLWRFQCNYSACKILFPDWPYFKLNVLIAENVCLESHEKKICWMSKRALSELSFLTCLSDNVSRALGLLHANLVRTILSNSVAFPDNSKKAAAVVKSSCIRGTSCSKGQFLNAWKCWLAACCIECHASQIAEFFLSNWFVRFATPQDFFSSAI